MSESLSIDTPVRIRPRMARFSPASVRAVESIERQVIASSVAAGWTSVLVDHHTVRPERNLVEVPATPDQTVVVVVRGCQEIEVLGRGSARRAIYRAGTSGLTPPGVAERLRRLPGPDGGPVEKVNVYLPAQLMAEVADHYRATGVRPRADPLSSSACQDRTTADTVVALARAAAVGTADLYAQAGALWLATHLISSGPHSLVANRDRRGPGRLLQRRLQAVLDLMESHYGDDLTLKRLAAEASVSEFHFVRLFRKSTGNTPHANLVHLRLEAARTMLAETDLSVGQISARCGFSRANHFSTAFKARFGCTPTQFRAGLAAAVRPAGIDTVGSPGALSEFLR